MGLQKNDLEFTTDSIFEIDSFKSKMGDDKDIVVLSFSVLGEQPALDLVNFIEKGYPFVLDADKSSGEQADGKYRVFVELERNNEVAKQVSELLDGIGKLTNLNEFKFRYYKNFKSLSADAKTLDEVIPFDPTAYETAIGEAPMENYKNFFKDSYVDDVILEDTTVIFKKRRHDPLFFEFIDYGNTKEVLKSIKESYEFNKFPEIIFLSKYIGDYNISIYGNKYVLENKNFCIVLKKKYETIN